MLYTRGGDDGQTGLWGCDQKISKSSAQAEALGALDEINSLLGLAKVKAGEWAGLLASVQQDLFIIQAEVGGAPKQISPERTKALEEFIDAAEKELPPIKTFLVAGGTELSALFDYARTIARRAERRVARLAEVKTEAAGDKIGEATLAYLNRLSSLLYALARLANWKSGIKEEPPRY